MSPVVRESRRGAQTVYREVLRKSCRTLKTRGRSMGPYGIEYKRIRAMGTAGCSLALICRWYSRMPALGARSCPCKGGLHLLRRFRGGGWVLLPCNGAHWTSSNARAASIDAKMRPDIEVVWVESNILLNLDKSTYLSRTKTKDAWE